MRVAIHYCINCGAQYSFQWSGAYDAVGIPKEYRDKEYCPDCKKAIVEALLTIEKKTEIKWLPANDVTLQQLLDFEKEQLALRIKEEQNRTDKFGFFPICQRVFAHLTNFDTGESSCDALVKYKGKEYAYHYWPLKPEDARISVKARVQVGTDIVVAYY